LQPLAERSELRLERFNSKMAKEFPEHARRWADLP